MNSQEVKKLASDFGVDLCGIASIDRFDEAPEGFHPLDVLPSCRSVIVLAKRFLAGTLKCKTSVPYTIVRNMLSDKLDKISVALCDELEKKKIIAIPTGTIGPTEYDAKTGRNRGIVSAKHAAVAAGLGVIGKNTLLITPEYGNMVWLTVILTEAELEADPLLENTYCNEACHLCIDSCPSHALTLGNKEMDQQTCWGSAFGEPENGGEWRIKCYKCREVCPYHLGSLNKEVMHN